jgi:hypothetical protein
LLCFACMLCFTLLGMLSFILFGMLCFACHALLRYRCSSNVITVIECSCESQLSNIVLMMGPTYVEHVCSGQATHTVFVGCLVTSGDKVKKI